MKERETCALHDPETHAQARRNGAISNSARAPLREAAMEVARAEIKLAAIEDIPATIERIAHQVAVGLIKPMTGGILAQLARSAVSAHLAIDELAERAHKRRVGLSDDQVREALERIRAAQTRPESLS